MTAEYVEDLELDAKLIAESYRLDNDPDKGKKFRAYAQSLGVDKQASYVRALALLLDYNPAYAQAVKARALEILEPPFEQDADLDATLCLLATVVWPGEPYADFYEVAAPLLAGRMGRGEWIQTQPRAYQKAVWALYLEKCTAYAALKAEAKES